LRTAKQRQAEQVALDGAAAFAAIRRFLAVGEGEEEGAAPRTWLVRAIEAGGDEVRQRALEDPDLKPVNAKPQT
jgi:hypothetical protein